MKAMMINAVAGLLVFCGTCGIASAKNCKDVTVKVKNDFVHAGNKQPIKVVDFDYWDNVDAKWREEFGISNSIIDNGHVGIAGDTRPGTCGRRKGRGCRVQYKYLSASSGDWSEILNAESGTFTCMADGPNAVTVVVSGV